MKKRLYMLLALMLCCVTVLTSCDLGATITTTTTTTPTDPPPTEATVNADSYIIYANAVLPTASNYSSYYMEAKTVLDFQKKLKRALRLDLPCVQASAQGDKRGIDARVNTAMQKDRWSISVQNGSICVRGGHYFSLEAGLDALLAKLKQTNGVLPLDYSQSGTAPNVFADSLDQSYVPYGATGNYYLVWNDEFNSATLDYDKWSFNGENPVKDGVERSNSAYIANGTLVLPASKEEGAELFQTTNLVTTFDTMNFHGGYLEMRAKIPFQDIGEWVSLWTTTGHSVLFKRDFWRAGNTGNLENQANGGFGVEVDIFEVFSDQKYLESNIWLWHDFGDRTSQFSQMQEGTQGKDVPSPSSGYHTYTFYWNDDWMVFGIDGEPYAAVSLAVSAWGDKYYYSKERSALSLILQNDVFTKAYCEKYDWGHDDQADGNASYDSFFIIDYIRLYQCAEDKLYLPETVGEGMENFDYAKDVESYWR